MPSYEPHRVAQINQLYVVTLKWLVFSLHSDESGMPFHKLCLDKSYLIKCLTNQTESKVAAVTSMFPSSRLCISTHYELSLIKAAVPVYAAGCWNSWCKLWPEGRAAGTTTAGPDRIEHHLLLQRWQSESVNMFKRNSVVDYCYH